MLLGGCGRFREALGGSWEALGVSGRLWDAPGRPGEALGGSWEAPEKLLEALRGSGRLRDAPGRFGNMLCAKGQLV